MILERNETCAYLKYLQTAIIPAKTTILSSLEYHWLSLTYFLIIPNEWL